MGKNAVEIFEKEGFGKVRVVMLNGLPYFVGKDVAEILGYADPRSTVSKKVDTEDKGVAKIATPSGIQETTVINESGLYSLILGSKLDSAKTFKRWVTSEVLPEIRKTGMYKGKSPIAIECAEKRKVFAKSLQDHGIEKPYEYSNITIAMKEPFGLKEIKKKDMPDRDKLKIAAAEMLATAMLYDEHGYSEVKPVCVDASATVRDALTKRISA